MSGVARAGFDRREFGPSGVRSVDPPEEAESPLQQAHIVLLTRTHTSRTMPTAAGAARVAAPAVGHARAARARRHASRARRRRRRRRHSSSSSSTALGMERGRVDMSLTSRPVPCLPWLTSGFRRDPRHSSSLTTPYTVLPCPHPRFVVEILVTAHRIPCHTSSSYHVIIPGSSSRRSCGAARATAACARSSRRVVTHTHMWCVLFSHACLPDCPVGDATVAAGSRRTTQRRRVPSSRLPSQAERV